MHKRMHGKKRDREKKTNVLRQSTILAHARSNNKTRRTDQDHILVPLRLVAHLPKEQVRVVRRRERVVPLLLLLLRARGVRAEVGRRQAGLVLQRGAQADLELECPWCTYAKESGIQ